MNQNAYIVHYKELLDRFTAYVSMSQLIPLGAGYKSAAVTAEIGHLESVTARLEKNIDHTFKSIDRAVTENAGILRVTYDAFFAVCEKFCQAVSENYEAGTMESLGVLNRTFSENLAAITASNKDLENAVTTTTDSTKKSPRPQIFRSVLQKFLPSATFPSPGAPQAFALWEFSPERLGTPAHFFASGDWC